MEKEGPIYGYLLSERIAERTDGGWRPGAGAIYPALRSLAERGLARAVPGGTRRLYGITPKGRGLLRGIRRNWSSGGTGGPDLSRLWAEIAGSADPGEHLLRRLRRHLDSISVALERDPAMRAGARPLRVQVLREIESAADRLTSVPGTPAPRRRHRGAEGR
jgi:DNA-binding PadR family transcriptional regulator